MAKIGVIVPFYNTEKFIEKCIDSILNQTFRDIELILVDDGSTDTSGKICDRYAQNNENIRVIHCAHCGVADARNRGMNETTAEYIAFVDSDDWIDKRYLEILYELIMTYHADLVISGGINVIEGCKRNEKRVNNRQNILKNEVISKSEAYRRMLVGEGGMSVVPWAKLYHRKLTKLFDYPTGEIYEDLKVINKIIESSEIIVCTSYTGYFYLRRKGSIMHGKMSIAHKTGLINAKYVWNFVKENYSGIEDAAKVHYLRKCFDILNLMLADSRYRQECCKLREEIIKELHFLFSSNYVSFVEKVGGMCLLVGISWYKIVWRIYLWWTGKAFGTVTS